MDRLHLPEPCPDIEQPDLVLQTQNMQGADPECTNITVPDRIIIKRSCNLRANDPKHRELDKR